jgi:hypothetical protein
MTFPSKLLPRSTSINENLGGSLPFRLLSITLALTSLVRVEVNQTPAFVRLKAQLFVTNVGN